MESYIGGGKWKGVGWWWWCVGRWNSIPASLSLLLCLLLPPDWPPLEREEQEVEERCMHVERREQDWGTVLY